MTWELFEPASADCVGVFFCASVAQEGGQVVHGGLGQIQQKDLLEKHLLTDTLNTAAGGVETSPNPWK